MQGPGRETTKSSEQSLAERGKRQKSRKGRREKREVGSFKGIEREAGEKSGRPSV